MIPYHDTEWVPIKDGAEGWLEFGAKTTTNKLWKRQPMKIGLLANGVDQLPTVPGTGRRHSFFAWTQWPDKLALDCSVYWYLDSAFLQLFNCWEISCCVHMIINILKFMVI